MALSAALVISAFSANVHAEADSEHLVYFNTTATITDEQFEASRVDYDHTHVQNFGWSGWASEGASCGSAGYSYRLEGIEIIIVPAGTPAPGSTANSFWQA